MEDSKEVVVYRGAVIEFKHFVAGKGRVVNGLNGVYERLDDAKELVNEWYRNKEKLN